MNTSKRFFAIGLFAILFTSITIAQTLSKYQTQTFNIANGEKELSIDDAVKGQ